MSEELVEKLLYQQVEKPKKLIKTKIINVFEDRYRINVYVQVEENGFDKQKIAKSYFAKLKDNNLEILSQ